jgi:hypothetical protein
MSRFLPALALLVAAGVAFAAEPITPFNGKDLTGWKLKDAKKSHWKVILGTPLLDQNNPSQFDQRLSKSPNIPTLVNMKGGGTDIYTDEKFGSCTIEVEFRLPKGSNSGVYVMGEYEVQVFDSYGKQKLGQGDVGAIYSASAPKVNAAKKPGEWQKFVIEFVAPKFEGGKKVANAKFPKVTLNGQVIQENVEVKGATPGGLTGKEAATGPLMFQGDHGPVAYRNIKITPAGK